MAASVPAVFRNERLERRMLRLEFRIASFQHAVGASLKELAEAVNCNASVMERIVLAMKLQAEALPGETPLVETLKAGRGGH